MTDFSSLTPKKKLLLLRDLYIAALWFLGVPMKEIVKETNLGERQIYRIRDKYNMPGRGWDNGIHIYEFIKAHSIKDPNAYLWIKTFEKIDKNLRVIYPFYW